MEASDVLILVPENRFRTLLEVEEATDRVARRALQSASRTEDHRPGKEWLTNANAMEYLGLSKATLARYRADGRLPYSKVGGNVFYRRSDITALLEAGMHNE